MVERPPARRDRLAATVTRHPWPFVLLISILVNCWVLALSPVHLPDTPSYFRLNLTGRDRLPVVVIVFKALRRDTLIVIAQVLMAATAWTFLAREVALLLRDRRARIGTAMAVVALGATPAIANWNSVIQSESLSTSLLVVVVACALLTVRTNTASSAVLAMAALTLWLLSRSQNIILGLLVCLLALPVVLLRGTSRQRRTLVAAGSLCLLTLPIGLRNQTVTIRNLSQIVSVRVLTDSGTREWWYGHGLPRGSCLEALDATPYCVDRDQRLHSWFKSEGTSTYGRWLATRPVWAISAPIARGFGANSTLFDGPTLAADWLEDVDPWGVAWIGQVALALALAGVTAHAVVKRRISRAETTGLILVGIAIVWLIPSFHGAGLEMGRLALPSAVLAKVGVVAMVAGLLDSGAASHGTTSRRPRRAGSAAVERRSRSK